MGSFVYSFSTGARVCSPSSSVSTSLSPAWAALSLAGKADALCPASCPAQPASSAAASATPHAIRVHCFKNRSIFEQPPFSGQGSCRSALLLLSS